jgi:site-specific recombinase XerD
MGARKLPRFLSPAEVAEIFRTAELSPRDSFLLKSMYYLGLRNSEAKSMRIDDIDFINNNVKVVQGKGRKDRYVPIPEGFSEELRGFVEGRSGYLFEGRASQGTLSDRHIRRIVKYYAEKAGIRKFEEIHPHTLRHSYATHLQNNGVPLNVIQSMLGHERIETTTIYTHLGIDIARDFIDKAFIKPLPKGTGSFRKD